MSNLREAAQQALKALEWHLDRGTWGADLGGCAAALRDALAQEQTNGSWHDGLLEGRLRDRERWLAQQAEPVQEPLTDDEIMALWERHIRPISFARAIKRKVRGE